jgi:serine/threonine protein kinase
LGQGGIGAVFLACDLKLPEGAQVVIKVLLQHLLSGEDRDWFERKFRNEIEALARINHPGVVSALDAGQLPDGRAYFVMQYVPGATLRSVMTPRGISAKRAGELLRKIAQALDAAHERGVIHRDLKLGNIMLQTVGGEEYIKIIDFGIATVLETATAAATNLTKVVGTLAYMAPEQLQGRPTAASDLFALGVIAFEMVTGQLPFNADSDAQLIELQRAGTEERLRELRPGLPEAARAAILKAMAFEASNRYKDALDFSKAFNQALAKPDQSDPFQTELIDIVLDQPATRRWRWLLPTAVLIVLLVAVVAGTIAWRHLSSASNETPAGAPANPPAAAERSLSYSLLVQKNPKRYPGHQPSVVLGDISVEAGDRLRLQLSSPQPGYLYIINEWLLRANRPPDFTALFPNSLDNRGSAKISANQVVQLPPDEHWLRVEKDKGRGTEKFWLVWSEQSVPELEAVKVWANPKDAGYIRDSRQIEAMKRFLNAYPITEFKAETDEARQQIKLTGKGTVLVWLVKLDHR